MQEAVRTETVDRTRQLAEEVAGLTPDRLSARDLAQLKRLVLDHLGVALRGSSLPWGAALQDWAKTYENTGPCVLLGTALAATAPVAALVNATAAHGLELDDTHDESCSHPGAVVIATALAIGVEQGRSGAEVLAAIAAGYEVMARAGVATGAGETIEYGFHPTALFGGFGAATAAAKLYGLDAERIFRSWGLMLSMAGGSMQFVEDPQGTTVKRLHGGYGAQNGTIAAQFARLGIEGPAQALDGRYGLVRLFGRKPDLSRLAKAPGEELEIHRISLKAYPCCRQFHSTIDALREATDGFRLDPADIRSIRVGGPAILTTQHMMRRPDSMMAAQYSLPFALAASLVVDPNAYESYGEDKWRDRAVLEVADKVEAILDADMERVFPRHFGSWVEVVTGDGRTRRSEVLDSYGTPARPMPEDALRDKFTTLADPVMPDLDKDAVFRIVERLPELRDVGELTAFFVRDGS